MRLNELIQVIAESQKISQNSQKAIPNGSAVGVDPIPGGPVNFYYKYRLGVKMAGSPDDHHPYDEQGAFTDDMVMIGYSKADREIIDNANKAFGYKQKKVAKGKSEELDDVGKTSPVAQWNKTK
jgi:hypothetical protein